MYVPREAGLFWFSLVTKRTPKSQKRMRVSHPLYVLSNQVRDEVQKNRNVLSAMTHETYL